MRARILSFLLVALPCIVAGGVRADTTTATVSGFCPGPQATAFDLTIDFTPTSATSATVSFTALNTSGVYPFQSPSEGNPILTGFFFNIPGGASISYTDGRLLAGSTLVSNGASINGVPTPAGCTQLVTDLPETSWYTLVAGAATGQYGIFTSGLSTAEGIKAGLVDPNVYVACVAQGDVFSPVVVAGRVRFTVQLSNLPTSFNSAAGFLALCSTVHGEQQPSSLAGHMQGTGQNGANSCFIGKSCLPTSTHEATWGALKSFYR